QAAFLVGRGLFGSPQDFRIDEDARLVALLLLGEVHGHDTLGNTDLDGGKADAGRVIHGLEHVVDQSLDLTVNLLDRLRLEPQSPVREDDDLAHRHGGRCKRRRGTRQCSAPWHASRPGAGRLLIICSSFVLMPRIAVQWAMMDNLLPLATNNLAHLASAVAILVAGLTALTLLAVLCVPRLRGRDREGTKREMAGLARLQAETAGRFDAMCTMLAGGQADLHRAVNERLDSVTHHLSQSMSTTRQHTAESLARLGERLAGVGRAQKNITHPASQVTPAQGVASNKQPREALARARMEIIVRDSLPKDCYEFQFTLSNRCRPDCAIFLPDQCPLIIDAKFPLEAVTAFREAKADDERKQAAARVRLDVARHVADIADKYLIPGETQDLALMFVPSESVYADLHDNFDDLLQKAFRSRVVIVSPSLLMLAVQVIQSIQKDARMREAAGQIQVEVGHLMDDLKRLYERVLRLQQHFGQANEDVRQILISAEKVEKRGTRIKDVEFDDAAEAASNVIPAPIAHKLTAGD